MRALDTPMYSERSGYEIETLLRPLLACLFALLFVRLIVFISFCGFVFGFTFSCVLFPLLSCIVQSRYVFRRIFPVLCVCVALLTP